MEIKNVPAIGAFFNVVGAHTMRPTPFINLSGLLVILSRVRNERSRKIAPSLVALISSIANYTFEKHTACDGVELTTSEGAIFRLRSFLTLLKMTSNPLKLVGRMQCAPTKSKKAITINASLRYRPHKPNARRRLSLNAAATLPASTMLPT